MTVDGLSNFRDDEDDFRALEEDTQEEMTG